ncbi:ribonuclease E/G [Roseovarius sp. EL26]|uniref:Rne/Rng family ribonuclease n=1 Tax=Roseovarius sp. EL26 TaxID=2126672 RepID=UPI000EA01C5E|nr:ribonuclease E/G [Roseovarius sp. EL26]
MAKKMLIDATHAEETRVVVVDGNKVEEFDFESENKRQLAGNIYLAKVTRVEPSLQAAFVEYGGNRHGFLAFSEIHPDYYQIPVADREALLEEERAYAEAMKARDDEDEAPKRRSRSRSSSKAEKVKSEDAVVTADASDDTISGMETIDLEDEAGADTTLAADDAVETSTQDVDEQDSPAQGAAAEATIESTAEVADADSAAEEDNTDAADAAASDETSEAEGAVASSEDADSTDDADKDADKPEGKTRGRRRPRRNARRADAKDKDDSIESVADEDDSEDIRPPRKPRARRYKIQEVIKVRQILLVQVVKEERGNKGAALTTYLSLAGRYCVLMPNTARGGGISRKITNAPDRKKLKEIANEIDVPQGAGLIIRTAGAKRTKAEIKRDYEYLQRMWEQIRELTLKSIAPAKIYEEGDLIKRSIRDLYNREIEEVLVEGEGGYRIAKDFMKMIMPSHAKNVKHYTETMPLFARFQVESYLGSMFNPTVQLKSGGYIVIGVTEALVAIDVNSGRATKEGSIEDTATKTNLEAAEEVARQLRLRDLAGLIVIDFIDMDERKNNAAVEKRMKDKLKTDRARIQVGRISGFGLMEMSRQRLRPGMIEATTQPCPSCHGTGLIRSDDNLALSILRQIEEEGVRRRSREVLVKCPVGIANFLMNQKREHVAQIEARYGLSVRIEGDPMLISPDYTIEKFKTATRAVPEATAPVVSVDSSLMDDLPVEDEAEEVVATSEAETESEEQPKKKRRRRRRRSKGQRNEGDVATGEAQVEGADAATDAAVDDTKADTTEAKPDAEVVEAPAAQEGEAEATADADKPAPKRKRTRKKPAKKVEAAEAETAEASPKATDAAAEAPAEEAPAKPKRTRRKPAKAKVAAEEAPAAPAEEAPTAAEAPVEPAPEPVQEAAPEVKAEPEVAPAPEPVAVEAAPEPTPEPVAAVAVEEAVAPVVEEVAKAPVEAKPKRRGWWSLS